MGRRSWGSPASDSPDLDLDREALIAFLKERENAMQSEKFRPHFDTMINLGHLGVIVTLFITVGGTWMSNQSSIDAGAEARKQYIPIIQSLQEDSIGQKERQDAQGQAILQLRDAQAKTTDVLMKVVVDLERMKTILERSVSEPRAN